MLKNIKALWAGWAVVHGLLLATVLIYGTTDEDVHYYFLGMNPNAPDKDGPSSNPANPNNAAQMAAESGNGPLTEYPHTGTWPLRALDLISFDNETAFIKLFSLMCAIISGLFLWYILRWGRDNAQLNTATDKRNCRITAGWFWVLFCAAAGPLLLTRLDIVSGVLVAMSAAWLLTRPRISAFLLAFATLSKLWPGVLAAAFVGKFNIRATWVRLLSFGASLLGLALVTVFSSGVNRLVSPITYQDVRGLQVESVMATPFMAARIADPAKWTIDYAQSKSFEIFGPGVAQAVQVADVLLLATVAFALCFALWRFLRGGWTHETAILFALLMVCMLILTNKVFSPQYMVWLAPLIAVASLVVTTISTRTLFIMTLVISVLTTLVYPVTYLQLIEDNASLPLILLALRNSGIVVLTIYVGFCLFRACRGSRDADTSLNKHSEPARRTAQSQSSVAATR